MRKLYVAVGVAVAILMALSTVVLLTTQAPGRPSRAAYSIVEVCVTVTPKSVSVALNGQPITIGPIGVPRTCTGI